MPTVRRAPADLIEDQLTMGDVDTDVDSSSSSVTISFVQPELIRSRGENPRPVDVELDLVAGRVQITRINRPGKDDHPAFHRLEVDEADLRQVLGVGN